MSEPKALFLKAIPAGARWITVHPNGPGTDGQPVLIQDNPDGSAHVIGGAGGKLNYLRLRTVRKEGDYRKEVAQKRADKRDADRQQRDKDKAAGIYEAKSKRLQEVRTQQRKHEREFIDTVGKAMGWDKNETEFDPSKHPELSDIALAKAGDKHHRELLKRAHEAVDQQRKVLLNDAAARMESGLGEMPVDSPDHEVISVQDLDGSKPPSGSGLGFAAHYGDRAAAVGLTDADLQAEASAARAEKQAAMTDGERRAAVRRGETTKMIEKELEGIRGPDVPTRADKVDPAQAAELLRAEKKLRSIQRAARDASKEISSSDVEPKAYLLEHTADPELDGKVKEDLANDLRTLQTQTFLSEAAKIAGNDYHEQLAKHVSAGAFNAANALALAVGGDSLIDRSVVDVLGIAGAAQVLAHRLHTDLTPDEVANVGEAVEAFHLHHYMRTSADALKRAREFQQAAADISLGSPENGLELTAAQELNAKRREAISDAQRTLGIALGEMETNAALTVALRQGKRSSLQVPMGAISPESAIKQARALGLQRGDYRMDEVAGQRFLTVNPAGMSRLAKPVSRADVQQINRNLSIIRGDADEDGWLPRGFADRPDLAMNLQPGVAPQLAQPFSPGADLAQSLRDYIGGRAADGDTPADILADVQSSDFFDKVGDRREEYAAALDEVAPLRDAGGQIQRAETLAPSFDKFADEFVKRNLGSYHKPLNRQMLHVEHSSIEALHRALSETPEGVAAYKPIGDLTRQDAAGLRDFFYANVAKESPEQAGLRAEHEKHLAAEPERETVDMFGENARNPEHLAWEQRRNELSQQVSAAGLDWSRYVESMGSPEKAYEAVQDLVRSRVARGFVEAHNRLNPGKPLKLGRTVIRNNLDHLDTVDPAAREARLEKQRALTDALRERNAGRYAAGAVSEKLAAARERQAAFEQSQMGFFAAEPEPATEKALGADERYTVGHAAERTLAGMMSVVGQNFKPGAPVKLWQPTMSGKGIARQRAIKLLEANKRLGLHHGVGSGKTAVGLGAFSHLHSTGAVKRGLFLVPSIVQGQFGGEALRYLQPGKFKWHAQPGASREERIAAYKDPANNFAVMTHQSFRDDMVHLGARQAGIPEDELSKRLGAMTPAERKSWMAGVMKDEGINFDYLMVDEAHNALNRAGKENSTMANVVDALSANTPHYVSATADPVKNDVSEIHSALQKMDPERYADRDAFMRKYGVDTPAAKDQLQREMARYFYPENIDPGVQANKSEVHVPLGDAQRKAIAEIENHIATARLARMRGAVDVPAMQALSPATFEGLPEPQHEATAHELQKSLGIIRESAVARAINDHPESAKFDAVSREAAARRGKPGVVFAHSLDAVQRIKDRLEKEGHRVIALTGADSTKEKDRKRLQFNPEAGDASADIIVASDAGATGVNLQRGQWLLQHDTPITAKDHAQRRGRIHRTGQLNDVELIDLIGDHASERHARSRLARKYQLRELTTSPVGGLDDSPDSLAYFLKNRQTAPGLTQ